MKLVSVANQQVILRSGILGYFQILGKLGTFPALDGIRAIAILLVLARHAVKAIADKNSFIVDQWPATWLINLCFNGWLGVDLFFVLSGCLISFHLLKLEKIRTTKYGFKLYILKRICRTFPLYYASILIILFGLIPFYKPNLYDIQLELTNLAVFLQDFRGTQLLVPLWSLAVEEKFYLVAPFMILFISKMRSNGRAVTFLITLSLISVIFRSLLVMVFQPDSYSAFFWSYRARLAWDPIIIGMICVYLLSNENVKCFVQKHDKYVVSCSCTVLMILLCAKPWIESESFLSASLIIYATSILFGCLVYTSIVSVRISKGFLSNVLLRVISKLSYALYLTHYMVIPASLFLSSWLLGRSSGGLYVIWFLLFYLGLSFAFSLFLHFLIEKPFLLLKDRLN